jgi:vacuolar iron transporter family protein
VRTLIRLARLFGTGSVLPIVIRTESADMSKYARQPGIARSLVSEEREHRAALEQMAGRQPAEGAALIAQRERWHGGRFGSVRAAIFGINDGLVSNVALILGVAAAGSAEAGVILAGLAGALAGAFSMGAGEYTSVVSQRALLARQIELERREFADAPQEEQEELALILRHKGLPEGQAKEVAARIFQEPEQAFDMLVREELGIDPTDLGSPLGAAVPVSSRSWPGRFYRSSRSCWSMGRRPPLPAP